MPSRPASLRSACIKELYCSGHWKRAKRPTANFLPPSPPCRASARTPRPAPTPNLFPQPPRAAPQRAHLGQAYCQASPRPAPRAAPQRAHPGQPPHQSSSPSPPCRASSAHTSARHTAKPLPPSPRAAPQRAHPGQPPRKTAFFYSEMRYKEKGLARRGACYCM